MSVTVRMYPAIKKAIATISDKAWIPIEYADAVFNEGSGKWMSSPEGRRDCLHRVRRAEEKVEQVTGRLIVRRIPDFNADKNKAAGQDTLFDVWRSGR
jgi:hypothetical protein